MSFEFGDNPAGGGILGFEFTGAAARQGIDNVTFNGSELAATPEPPTWLLMAVALGLMGSCRRIRAAG